MDVMMGQQQTSPVADPHPRRLRLLLSSMPPLNPHTRVHTAHTPHRIHEWRLISGSEVCACSLCVRSWADAFAQPRSRTSLLPQL